MGHRRRSLLATGFAGAVLAVLATGAPAGAQVPLPPELPPLPIEEPSEEPSEDASPAPSDDTSNAPSDGATGGHSSGGDTPAAPSEAGEVPPDPEIAGDGATGPTDDPSGGDAALPGFDVLAPDGSVAAVPAGEPAPEVASSRPGGPAGAAPAAGSARSAAQPLAVDQVAAALPGTFSIALLAALLGVATLTGTLSLTRRGLLLATATDGGTDVDTTRRWRVMAGVALLAAAALVGILGYLRISIETLVPVQLVYLASAGFGVIVLAAAGGALLIAEQLRTDERRLTDIESALATIADHLRPGVADAPRLLDPGARAGRDGDRDATVQPVGP